MIETSVDHKSAEYTMPSEIFESEEQQISFMKLYIELLDSDISPDNVTLINDNGTPCNVENVVFDEKFKWN